MQLQKENGLDSILEEVGGAKESTKGLGFSECMHLLELSYVSFVFLGYPQHSTHLPLHSFMHIYIRIN